MLHGSVPRSITRSLNGSPVEPNHAPDGLTEQAIDALLRKLDLAAMTKPRPTSLLMDEMGTQRQHRRQARRCTAAVVRAWPARTVAGGPDGLVA